MDALTTANPPAEPSEESYPSEMICTGLRALQSGRYGTGWLDDGGKIHYMLKSPANTVGAIYRWQFVALDRAQVWTKGPNGPQFVRMETRAVEPRIPEWEAESIAAQMERRRKLAAKREQASDFKQALAPFHQAYRKLDRGPDRAAYLASVIEAITG